MIRDFLLKIKLSLTLLGSLLIADQSSISGQHVHAANLDIQSLGFTPDAPYPYYENTGAMGGKFIIDLMIGYRIMENIDLSFRINNLTDQEDVIAVGSPPARRFSSLGLKLTF